MEKEKSRLMEGKERLEQGRYRFNRDILKESISIFEELINKEPDEYLYYYYLGCAYEGVALLCEINGDDEGKKEWGKKVIEAMEKSIELNDEFLDSHRALGQMCGSMITDPFTAMKYISKAEREMSIVMNLNPEDLNVCLWQAIKYIKAPKPFGGNIEKAMEKCRQIIETNPKFDQAYVWWGIACEKDGKLEKAKDCWEKALSINPNNLHAQKNLTQVIKMTT
ncbi:MAG: tetratricopeptide repeat protein [bacterium]